MWLRKSVGWRQARTSEGASPTEGAPKTLHGTGIVTDKAGEARSSFRGGSGSSRKKGVGKRQDPSERHME